MTPRSRFGDARENPLRRAADVLRRRWFWGLGVGLFVVSAAAVIVLTARPVYRAEARLRLGEPPPTAGISPTGGLLSFLRTGGDPFANDLELLTSRTLAEEVVRAALLNVRLVAPSGWHRDSIFASLAQIDTTRKASFEVTWQADGTVALEARSPDRVDLGRARTGEVVEFGGLEAVFLPRKEKGPASVTIKTVPFDEAVRVERGRIRTERTRREANVLDVSYAHHDPGIADFVVRRAVQGFLDLRTELFQRESDETVDSLRAVAMGTQAELRRAEDALEQIQRETGLVAPDAQSEALVERYETAYQALLAVRTERDAIVTQLERVHRAANRVEAWSTLVALPVFLENETLAGMLERLTALEEMKTEALSLRTPGSREVQTLEAQIVQLDGALRTVIDEYAVGLAERVTVLQEQLDEFEEQLGGLPADVVELGRRQRDVRILTEVAVVTEQRLRQEELRQALAFSNVQVIDEPALRFRPVWPRKKLGLAVGALLGGLLGMASIVLLERTDGSVRQASSVHALTNAPVLAALTINGESLAQDAGAATAVNGRNGRGRVVALTRSTQPWAGALGKALSVAPDRLVQVGELGDALALGSADVVLTVVAGRTAEEELQRVVSLLDEGGCRIAGTILVCRTARDADALWG